MNRRLQCLTYSEITATAHPSHPDIMTYIITETTRGLLFVTQEGQSFLSSVTKTFSENANDSEYTTCRQSESGIDRDCSFIQALIEKGER